MNARRFSSFVVLAEMRTGSNLLQAQLNRVPGLRCHGEVFNPAFVDDPATRSFLASTRAARDADPLGLLRRIGRRAMRSRVFASLATTTRGGSRRASPIRRAPRSCWGATRSSRSSRSRSRSRRAMGAGAGAGAAARAGAFRSGRVRGLSRPPRCLSPTGDGRAPDDGADGLLCRLRGSRAARGARGLVAFLGWRRLRPRSSPRPSRCAARTRSRPRPRSRTPRDGGAPSRGSTGAGWRAVRARAASAGVGGRCPDRGARADPVVAGRGGAAACARCRLAGRIGRAAGGGVLAGFGPRVLGRWLERNAGRRSVFSIIDHPLPRAHRAFAAAVIGGMRPRSGR